MLLLLGMLGAALCGCRQAGMPQPPSSSWVVDQMRHSVKEAPWKPAEDAQEDSVDQATSLKREFVMGTFMPKASPKGDMATLVERVPPPVMEEVGLLRGGGFVAGVALQLAAIPPLVVGLVVFKEETDSAAFAGLMGAAGGSFGAALVFIGLDAVRVNVRVGMLDRLTCGPGCLVW